MIVADADLGAALSASLAAPMIIAGQMFMACRRILVYVSKFHDATASSRTKVSMIVVGNPNDALTQVGPLISLPQLDKVCRYSTSPAPTEWYSAEKPERTRWIEPRTGDGCVPCNDFYTPLRSSQRLLSARRIINDDQELDRCRTVVPPTVIFHRTPTALLTQKEYPEEPDR